jgi:3alpha(or 20beta)-hydroxysteroid dehydrogenase
VAQLDGKVALITGAARGQGLAAAKLFVSRGAKVAIADVLAEEASAAAKELGDAAFAVSLDVSDEEEWVAAVAATEERFGSLNVLVNNAGILRFSELEATTLADYMQVINVNQVGVFLGMRAAVPAMRRAGGGSIVNISSVEGLRGMPGLVAYGASKFAVRGMTKVAAVELGKHGIRANSVHPGAIDTPMTRSQGLEGVDMDRIFKRIPIPRAGRPEDVATMVAFLASDDSSYVTGGEFVVDGGATAYIAYTGAPERRA